MPGEDIVVEGAEGAEGSVSPDTSDAPAEGAEDSLSGGEDGGAGAAPPTPAPKYFSHDDARALFSESFNRVTEQLEGRFSSLLDQRLAALQPRTPQDPPKETLFPTTNAEMEQMLQDPWGWVEMVKKAHGSLAERLEALEGNFTQFRTGYEKQGKTQQVVQWLDDQCMEAIEGFDSFLNEKGEVDTEMYSALKALVTGYIQRNKGLRGLNVKAMAKSLHDRINRVVESRYKKKLQPPSTQPPPAKPTGHPSTPKPKPPESREAATEGFRATIANLAKE